jgi:hypothetical protein
VVDVDGELVAVTVGALVDDTAGELVDDADEYGVADVPPSGADAEPLSDDGAGDVESPLDGGVDDERLAGDAAGEDEPPGAGVGEPGAVGAGMVLVGVCIVGTGGEDSLTIGARATAFASAATTGVLADGPGPAAVAAAGASE